jgi:Tfp pilus assembly protein PilX
MSYPWNTWHEEALNAAEAALFEAERFVKKLTVYVHQLRTAKSANTGDIGSAEAAAAAKRASLDLTKQLAKFRRGES